MTMMSTSPSSSSFSSSSSPGGIVAAAGVNKFEYYLRPTLHWATQYDSSASTTTTTTPTSRQEDQQAPFTTTTTTAAASSSSHPVVVFGKGNMIRQSPFDEDILYATSTDGTLLVISATNGTILQSTIRPRPRILTENGKTSVWNLSSSSGISFGSTNKSFRTGGSSGSSSSSSTENDEDQNQEEGRDFLVYSVTDIPPPTSRFLPKSRVVAVSIPQHTILWTSAEVSGTTRGTPVIYSYGYHHQQFHPQQQQQDSQQQRLQQHRPSGSAILITHNSVVVRSSDNRTLVTGHVTLLDVNSGHVRWTESDSMRFPDMSSKSYGPPTIYRHPTFGGNFLRGQNNTNDIVVWTTMTSTSIDTSTEDISSSSLSSSTTSASTPSSESGYLHVFQMPMGTTSFVGGQNNISKQHNELPDEANVDTQLSTQNLLQVPWTAISPPTIGRQGTSLFVGSTEDQVHGWVGVHDDDDDVDSMHIDDRISTNEERRRRWDQMPDWTASLSMSSLPTTNPTDGARPIPTSPVLSLDNERLFVTPSSLSSSSSSTAQNEVVALDVDTGERLWSVSLGKAMMTSKVQISPDDDRLYIALRTEDVGTEIVTIEQRSGRVVWRTNNNYMQSITSMGEILADFEVSSLGTHIFFAGEGGSIISLKVGHDGPLAEASSSTNVTNDTYTDEGIGSIPEGEGSTVEKNANNMANSQNADDESRRLGGGAVSAIVMGLIVASVVGLLYLVRLRGRQERRSQQRNSKGSDGFAGVSLHPKTQDVGVVPVRIDRYYHNDNLNDPFDDPRGDTIANCDEGEGSTTMVDLRETMMVDVGMMYDPEPFIQNDDQRQVSDDTTKRWDIGDNPSTSNDAEDFGYGSAIVV